MHEPNLCLSCKHLDRGPAEHWPTIICVAYPKGIPPEIYYMGADHREPRDGDGGVVYELKPGMEPEFQMWISRVKEDGELLDEGEPLDEPLEL